MIKIDYKSLIKEELAELKRHKKEVSSKKLLERCEVLIWLKSGEIETMKKAMELKSRSVSHGRNLWKLYKTKGLKGYLELNYQSRISPLSGKKELEEHLEQEGFRTINEAREWILKVYNISYTENGLGNYFRSRKIKLKTGRPHHPKKDEEKRKLYKKNMKMS